MTDRSLSLSLTRDWQPLADAPLKRTPLHDTHVAAGARMVPFGGWEMPVQYRDGIISETKSVRASAGMFDVSHMGRVEFSGRGAVAFLDTILSANVAALKPGRSKYHVICDERGGIIDDAIVYRLDDEKCLLVINAGNTDADLRWVRSKMSGRTGVTLTDITAYTGMIAVQGPAAVATLDGLSGGAASEVRRFRIGDVAVAGIPCRIARTGYTGEDGYEVMPPAGRAAELWAALKAAGVDECGLGARDVLRLEAGLMLHGNDMTVENNPFEAGLEWTLSLDKEGYIPGPALREIKAKGTQRVIAGLRMTGRGIPRHGMDILSGGDRAGTVTSGTHSPTLDADIGMGYVDRQLATPGTPIDIDVRGRIITAEIVELPFYKRSQ
jgi:aminomethyltransferase